MNLHDRLRTLLGLAALACALLATSADPPAQSMQAVVPAAAQGTEGIGVEPFLVSWYGRTQVVIDRAQLGQLAGNAIRRIVVRRDAQTNDSFPGGMQGGWIDLEVLASWTPRDPRNPAAAFAANHDPTKAPAVVYRGEYHLADSPPLPKGTKVASFAPGVSAHIVLQTPIAAATTGNLCVEFIRRQHASKTPPGIWLGDRVKTPPSSRLFAGRSCWRPQRGDHLAARLLPDAMVGGTLKCTTFGPLTPLALLVLGASNTQWGLLRLPFDLSNYGAPGCYLYCSQDLVLPSTLRRFPASPDAEAHAQLSIPYLAGLAGARIHSQWLFYHPGANAMSLTTTNGVSVAIAGTSGIGASMVQSLDPNAKTGTVHVDRAPVMQLADR